MVDAVNTHEEESGQAPEGHNQAMADAVDAKQAEMEGTGQDAPTNEGQSEKILGKFDSQEDLARAYQELEQKMSGKGTDTTEGEGDETTDKGEMNAEKADSLLENSDVDVNAMSEHFAENGSLDESHYEALEKAGIPKQFVDQYISGVQAEVENMQNEIFDEVGGRETFNGMSEWAVQNLSEAEIESYNRQIDNDDPAVVRNAVMGLAYRYQQTNGRDPNLVNGKGAGTAPGFESTAQLTEAMKDPRYSSDPAYRREVEQKLKNSNIM